jgi:hypothetical protein
LVSLGAGRVFKPATAATVTKTCPAGFFYEEAINQCRVCATKWGACDLCTSDGCFQCSFGTINNFLDPETKTCIRMCTSQVIVRVFWRSAL